MPMDIMEYKPKPLDALNDKPEVERRLGISASSFRAYEQDMNPEFEGMLSDLYGPMRELAEKTESKRKRSMHSFED
jgi:hypothetical protein